MSFRLVNIGFGNIVSGGRVIAIVSPESAPIKRIVQEARESGRLIDATCGRRTRAVVEEYRQKLTERIELLLGSVEVDRARLATEVALFADRASIDEEIVRLRSHAEQMRLLLADSEPAGRKLDFVVQEMNREFNTIGSKANDGELTKRVLLAKAEIEKIREQVQNIE